MSVDELSWYPRVGLRSFVRWYLYRAKKNFWTWTLDVKLKAHHKGSLSESLLPCTCVLGRSLRCLYRVNVSEEVLDAVTCKSWHHSVRVAAPPAFQFRGQTTLVRLKGEVDCQLPVVSRFLIHDAVDALVDLGFSFTHLLVRLLEIAILYLLAFPLGSWGFGLLV